MKKFSWFDGAALVVWLLPLGYLFFVYDSMPATVPMHYGINGTVDRYGSKHEFLMFQWLMLGMPALVYLLMKYLPAIDPKKQVKYGEATFQKLGLGLVLFFSALDVVIIYATLHHGGLKIEKLIFPLIGLLFAFLGNVMYNIKPNYFAGIKAPWALENEDNWRATHRLAGKLWFVGGISLTIFELFLPAPVGTFVFSGTVVVMALIPYAYSYIYFKNHQPK